jgi:hypothetical protein
MLIGDLEYANSGKIRSQKLSPDLEGIIKKTAKDFGYDVRVISGGQPKTGKKRTGTDRHNDGHAGDLQLLKNGKVVDIEANKDAVAPVFTALVKNGVTSIGYHPNYMGRSTFHADNAVVYGQGKGGTRTWGAKGEGAPSWLTQAVNAGYNAEGSIAREITKEKPSYSGNTSSSQPSEENYNQLKNRISSVESANNYSPTQSSVNPSMSGKYQFDWGLYGDPIKKLTGVKNREEFLASKDAQEKFMDYHVKNNLKPEAEKRFQAVKKLHPDVTLEDVMLLGHHQGFGNMDAGIKKGDILSFQDAAGNNAKSYLSRSRKPLSTSESTPSANVSSGVPSQPAFNSNLQDVPEWKAGTLTKLDPIKPNNEPITNETAQLAGKSARLLGQNSKVAAKEILTTPQQTETMPETTNKRKIPKFNIGDMTPYLSNVANAFQKPAAVPMPLMDRPIQLDRVSYDNDRYESQKDYRGTMLNADATLDANTSVGVKQLAKAQKFAQMSAINQAEQNQNRDISNKEALYNASISQGNNAKLYDNRVNIADRENAIKRERSANLANAADKMIMQANVRNQQGLEERKLDILASNDNYGAYQRMLDRIEATKKKREEYGFGGRIGGKVPRFSAGSFMQKFKPSM